MKRILTAITIAAALALSACGSNNTTPAAPSACAQESGSYACAQQNQHEQIESECSAEHPGDSFAVRVCTENRVGIHEAGEQSKAILEGR